MIDAAINYLKAQKVYIETIAKALEDDANEIVKRAMDTAAGAPNEYVEKIGQLGAFAVEALRGRARRLEMVLGNHADVIESLTPKTLRAPVDAPLKGHLGQQYAITAGQRSGVFASVWHDVPIGGVMDTRQMQTRAVYSLGVLEPGEIIEVQLCDPNEGRPESTEPPKEVALAGEFTLTPKDVAEITEAAVEPFRGVTAVDRDTLGKVWDVLTRSYETAEAQGLADELAHLLPAVGDDKPSTIPAPAQGDLPNGGAREQSDIERLFEAWSKGPHTKEARHAFGMCQRAVGSFLDGKLNVDLTDYFERIPVAATPAQRDVKRDPERRAALIEVLRAAAALRTELPEVAFTGQGAMPMLLDALDLVELARPEGMTAAQFVDAAQSEFAKPPAVEETPELAKAVAARVLEWVARTAVRLHTSSSNFIERAELNIYLHSPEFDDDDDESNLVTATFSETTAPEDIVGRCGEP